MCVRIHARVYACSLAGTYLVSVRHRREIECGSLVKCEGSARDGAVGLAARAVSGCVRVCVVSACVCVYVCLCVCALHVCR